MPFLHKNIHSLSLALPPSPPQIMTAGAGVTQGFPRIGFPLTTTRRPISLHLALGSERERQRQDKENEISNGLVLSDETPTEKERIK